MPIEEHMDALALWQIDSMDAGEIMEIVIDSMKEYWRTYPEEFEFQWEEYETMKEGEDFDEV